MGVACRLGNRCLCWDWPINSMGACHQNSRESLKVFNSSWLSLLEATKWLQHLSLLLKSALMVVNTVDKEACPVVVHCSDGWDRTPQIVALAELMLDSYYRTLEGFQVLVEREWLNFGHKFGDRCGHKPNDDDVNQRCPVFLQWLDCVHQLLKQYPTAFEFNETFLVVASELEDEKDRDASSRCGSITSDISWEQVDETETKRTLWIPDHAVTHCCKCNTV